MTNHTHTLDCDMTTVTTTVNGVTTHSAEFACGPTAQAMVDTERELQVVTTLAIFGADADTRARNANHRATLKARLYAMVDAAGPVVLREYGIARRA